MTGIAEACEAALGAAIFILPGLLALASRGVAALEIAAGLCAAGVVLARPSPVPVRLRHPAVLLAVLVAWGALSALWSIDPARSLMLAARLAALFAAGLALAAAAPRIARPQRLLALFLAGSIIGIILAAIDFATGGGLNGTLHNRPYRPTELNQVTVILAILAAPAGAALWGRSRGAASAAVAVAAGAVILLVDESAKLGLALGVAAAGLVYWQRRPMARLFVALSVLAIVFAPMTLPRLAHMPAVFDAVDGFKQSAGHRLMIWAFVGTRISERPVLGWGLDSSRAIPGGRYEIRPGFARLPLHPHNAALQVWLELGGVGVLPVAALVALLWYRIRGADWPRRYAAAAAAGLAAALTIAFASYGIWQEWWLGTLALAMFLVLAFGRAAAEA